MVWLDDVVCVHNIEQECFFTDIDTDFLAFMEQVDCVRIEIKGEWSVMNYTFLCVFPLLCDVHILEQPNFISSAPRTSKWSSGYLDFWRMLSFVSCLFCGLF